MDRIIIFPLLLVFPLALHLGLLRGDPFYPKKSTGDKRVDAFFKKYIKYIIALNGVLLCLIAVIGEQLGEGPCILATLVAAPSFAAQLSFAMMAKLQGMKS